MALNGGVQDDSAGKEEEEYKGRTENEVLEVETGDVLALNY